MYWKYDSGRTTSSIDTILEKEDVTLKEVKFGVGRKIPIKTIGENPMIFGQPDPTFNNRYI